MIYFENNINDIKPFFQTVYDAEVLMPFNRKVYFLAKFQELMSRYKTARRYLDKTESSDWEYLLKNVDKDVFSLAKLSYRAEYYEFALINYNIAFDLSWVLCYVSLEYGLWKNETVTYVGELEYTEKAEELLRKLEQYVSTPGAIDNPLAYLKTKNIKSEEIIGNMEEFWDEFRQNSVRSKYNYSKHRGKLAYKEILDLDVSPKANISYIYADGSEITLPSHISDVQMKCSLEDSISELIVFDNRKFYPYIKTLVEMLSKLVNPSPLMGF